MASSGFPTKKQSGSATIVLTEESNKEDTINLVLKPRNDDGGDTGSGSTSNSEVVAANRQEGTVDITSEKDILIREYCGKLTDYLLRLKLIAKDAQNAANQAGEACSKIQNVFSEMNNVAQALKLVWDTDEDPDDESNLEEVLLTKVYNLFKHAVDTEECVVKSWKSCEAACLQTKALWNAVKIDFTEIRKVLSIEETSQQQADGLKLLLAEPSNTTVHQGFGLRKVPRGREGLQVLPMPTKIGNSTLLKEGGEGLQILPMPTKIGDSTLLKEGREGLQVLPMLTKMVDSTSLKEGREGLQVME